MVPGLVPDLLLGLLLLAGFDAIALMPVLLSSAVRRLVRLWPTDSLGVNYLAGAAAFGASHLALIMLAVALHGGHLQQDVFKWVAGMTLLNALGWWLGLAVYLPLKGLWLPKSGGEFDGRIALTAGLVGYAVAMAVALVLIAIVGFLLFYPG